MDSPTESYDSLTKAERFRVIAGLAALSATFVVAWLTGGSDGPMCFGVRAEFVLFGITLAGVALLHRHTLPVAMAGLTSLLLLKFSLTGFDLGHHLEQEWKLLLNLLGLLLGFALLAKHFEESRVPAVLPKYLPDDWKGGFALLVMVAVLSSFLDNIAAAMIGGTMASVVYRHKLHVGFLAAIVAASNAGGAGSVVGDTTTTMMWIDGVSPLDVLHGFAGSVVAVVFSGIFAAKQQQAFQPIQKNPREGVTIDWLKVGIVAGILAGAIVANFALDFPAVGVWAAILLGACFSRTAWREIPAAFKGSIFLLSLVMCASMMPVEQLPKASWQTAFGLGFVSAVFDNIPLTKLALDQGGYDWGVLAFTIGYGGSMIWFGSSAGVALSNMFPQAKSVGQWVKHGWHVTVAYILAVAAMLLVMGWHPHPAHKKVKPPAPPAMEQPARPGKRKTAADASHSRKMSFDALRETGPGVGFHIGWRHTAPRGLTRSSPTGSDKRYEIPPLRPSGGLPFPADLSIVSPGETHIAGKIDRRNNVSRAVECQ